MRIINSNQYVTTMKTKFTKKNKKKKATMPVIIFFKKMI